MIVEVQDIKTEEFLVNFGPQHPSTHGVLRLLVKLDGEVVVDVVPVIGYLHRSMEKIAEKRTYTQFIPYTDRLDYIASMSNNFGYVLAVEQLMKLKVPERAEYLRVIIVELNRIASHLLAVGTFVQDLGAYVTPLFYAFREREWIVDLFEQICGARLTYNYMRIGGVSQDMPEGFPQNVKKFLNYFRPKLDDFEKLVTANPIFLSRTKGIGVLPADTAVSYGVSGPTLRGSGVKYDVRKNAPYSIYERFSFDIPTGANGDAWDRYKVRIEEMRQSVRILEQAVENIPEGEYLAKLPKIFKVPEGEVYHRIEAPRGELGFYIVSKGDFNPYRLKIRAPSFSNLAAIRDISIGAKVADLIAILGSLDIVLGEIDR